jgi:hypothetical protein
VNTSVTGINLDSTGVGTEVASSIKALLARNKRRRHLFLFDARQMLLSVLCADECGVVWPYVLEGDKLAAVKARSVDKTLRAEFAVVVEERRRRAVHLVANVADGDSGNRAVKRRRAN